VSGLELVGTRSRRKRAQEHPASSFGNQGLQQPHVVLELGLGLPAWNKLSVHQAVQPFTLGTAGAEPYPVQFSIPVRIKIPSQEPVPASLPLLWVAHRDHQHPRLWRRGLDEYDFHVGAAAAGHHPSGGPPLVVRQGQATAAKLALQLPAVRRERHQVQILVRSGPAANKEVHRHPTAQLYRRRDAPERPENVEDLCRLNAHAKMMP
jgi:hypothetical protein